MYKTSSEVLFLFDIEILRLIVVLFMQYVDTFFFPFFFFFFFFFFFALISFE